MNPSSPTADSPRRRWLLVAVLAAATALRLAHWFAVRDEPFVAEPVLDSAEYSRWAQALSAGASSASEDGAFFQAPLYPYGISVLYRLFGVDPDAVYLAQIGFAVAAVWALYRAGRSLLDAELGLVAAALMALYPVFVFHDVLLLKESLAVSLTSFLLWSLVEARRRGAVAPWLWSGLLLGLLGLLRENLLLTAPLLAVLPALPPGPARRRLARTCVFLFGVAVALTPVALHNRRAGAGFLPTTFQGGVNFYIGNNPAADGTYRPLVPGKQTPADERAESVRLARQAAGRDLAPAEVSRYWLGRALAWARSEPLAFARLQLRKLGLFLRWYEWPDAVDFYYLRTRSPALRLPGWELGGVSLLAAGGFALLLLGRGRRDERARFAPIVLWALASTATTVAFFLFSRYRLPTVPALLLLAALPLTAALDAWRTRRRLAAAALLAFALAAACLPEAAAPRGDLVHTNLGRLHQEAGRPREAEASYRAALAVDPSGLPALLGLGRIAAQAGRVEEARDLYARAAAAAPESDEAAANLGSARLASGQPEAAEAALRRALELNPESVAALHSLALLRLSQGRRDEALALNRRALALDPDQPALLRLEERLGDPVHPE